MLKFFYMDQAETPLLAHLEKIGHFQAVATHGSFLRAAKSLGQTQPTLLYSVKTLENVIGSPLFTRSRSGARLTAAGQKFLEFATNVTHLTRELERDLRGSDHSTNKYTLAAHTPYLPSLLLPNLKLLTKAFKASAIDLKSSLSRTQLIHWVECGAVDAALVADGAIPKTLRQTLIFQDHYEFYASKSFIKEHLGNRELGVKHFNLPFVYLSNSISGLRQTLGNTLAEIKLADESAIEVDSFEAVAATAEMSLAIAILPKMTALNERFNLVKLKTEPSLRALGKFSIMMCYKDVSIERYLPAIKTTFQSFT